MTEKIGNKDNRSNVSSVYTKCLAYAILLTYTTGLLGHRASISGAGEFQYKIPDSVELYCGSIMTKFI